MISFEAPSGMAVVMHVRKIQNQTVGSRNCKLYAKQQKTQNRQKTMAHHLISIEIDKPDRAKKTNFKTFCHRLHQFLYNL